MSKDENGRATADYIARILGLEPYPADMMVIMTARVSNDSSCLDMASTNDFIDRITGTKL